MRPTPHISQSPTSFSPRICTLGLLSKSITWVHRLPSQR
ncbi:hypothetical protein Pla133_34650 [Planctomycetes bacterium Pla133]|uniref:Uncharacterized protein n=1 Tax=Engelhardtia mirabilis TaxID=2528011 RepID=A0A518BN13_9BACT|nr:hypothetical protein Pla133_34650 [Planctomycetes bacterium Pla133]